MLMMCDRCFKDFEGYRGDNVTSGYYDVGNGWIEYRQYDKEKVICDDCMWKDPKYQLAYSVGPATNWRRE